MSPLFKEEDYVKTHRFQTKVSKHVGGLHNLTWVRLVCYRSNEIRIATGTHIDLLTDDGLRVPIEFARFPSNKDDYVEAAKKLVGVFGKKDIEKINIDNVAQMIGNLFGKKPASNTQVLKIARDGVVELSTH